MIEGLVREFWGVILSVVATVVWLVRLESVGKQNAGEIRALWRQRKEDLESSRLAREETNRLLAEMRADIKTLLTRGGAR